MLARIVAASLLGSFALLGAATPDAGAEPPPGRFITERVWIDPVRDMPLDSRGGQVVSKIIYVNRCAGDCIVTPGNNDARQNTSSIVGETRTITEFEHGDEVYDQVVACLRDVFSPYDVEIVTEDPGTGTFHHEAILAGTPDEIGRDQNVGGIAPASCDPLNNVISFSFANQLGPGVEDLCWTVAQESAHAFGLPNHVYDCLDPMTYLPGPCGRKYFRNRALPCGEFEPGPCTCGANAQNSHRELLATFGEGTAPPPPEVSLLYPEPDAAVDDNFSIFFTAIDPRLVERVDVYLNGVKYMSAPGHEFAQLDEPYSVTAPDHPDGYIDIEVRAYNEISGEAGTDTARVLKGAPCESSDQCFDFMDCSEGRCSYPPPEGELGDSCQYDQYCIDGPCASVDGDRRCTRECPVGVSDSCPEGFECRAPGFCWNDSGGGGCGAAGSERDGLPIAALSLFAAALLLRRRRTRRV
jgi:uncharacterized protein (TIGR03382 family)